MTKKFFKNRQTQESNPDYWCSRRACFLYTNPHLLNDEKKKLFQIYHTRVWQKCHPPVLKRSKYTFDPIGLSLLRVLFGSLEFLRVL